MKKRKIIICVVAFCIVVLVGVFVGVSSHRDYTKALDIPQKSEISIKQYSTGKEIQLENDDADKMAEMLKEHLSYKGITYDDSVVSSEEDVYSIMISSTDFLFNPMLMFLQIHKKMGPVQIRPDPSLESIPLHLLKIKRSVIYQSV